MRKILFLSAKFLLQCNDPADLILSSLKFRAEKDLHVDDDDDQD